MKKNKIPRLWGIPLFDDYNLWNASDKDLERLDKDEISIVRYIGFFCMIFLFIYYWIVDYGKPGFMEQVIDTENATRADNLIIKWQDKLDFLPHGFVNFIADLFLYGCLSFIVGTIVAIILNFLFKRIIYK